jgi:hypothetical protein
MAGFPEVFVNIDPIVVMFLAWLVVILCFFVLAVQLFITLIEFKLTTLAGFVLVPFALWNKTSLPRGKGARQRGVVRHQGTWCWPSSSASDRACSRSSRFTPTSRPSTMRWS